MTGVGGDTHYGVEYLRCVGCVHTWHGGGWGGQAYSQGATTLPLHLYSKIEFEYILCPFLLSVVWPMSEQVGCYLLHLYTSTTALYIS